MENLYYVISQNFDMLHKNMTIFIFHLDKNRLSIKSTTSQFLIGNQISRLDKNDHDFFNYLNLFYQNFIQFLKLCQERYINFSTHLSSLRWLPGQIAKMLIIGPINFNFSQMRVLVVKIRIFKK